MTNQLTDEQKLVKAHSPGSHGRVLAVAGSGKTTTLVHYLIELVNTNGVNPKSVLVLMYNRLARRDFKKKLVELDGPSSLLPGRVFTFHALSYKFIEEAVKCGQLLGPLNMWTEDKEELERLALHKILNALEAQGVLKPSEVDIEEAQDAIHAWKASLIPPERAGYGGNQHMTLVYREFEKFRKRENALTYDDFVPEAVKLVSTNAGIPESTIGAAKFIIIDEYQDINWAQHRLVKHLSGDTADIVVVGDDDQTIYEWRGARPSFIKNFDSEHADKECKTYALTRSFRFGPSIADPAARCIEHNQQRFPKTLRAHFDEKESDITVLLDRSEQPAESAKEMTEIVQSLIRDHRADGKDIAVLGRLFAQLDPLEVFFLQSKIPYRVLGRRPFFQRAEVQVLLDYFRVALDLGQDFQKQHSQQIVAIANKPSRMLPRRVLESEFRAFRARGGSVSDAIVFVANNERNSLRSGPREKLIDLHVVLRDLSRAMEAEGSKSLGALARDLVKKLRYLEQFDDYYGKGIPSLGMKRTVLNFLTFAEDTGLGVREFLEYVDSLDTTQGAEEHEQVLFTTIFRTKGLEFDYVFIPGCNEGSMPMQFDEYVPTFDTEGIVPQEPLSPLIERERRLFYVGVTRAKRAVYISASAGSKGADSQGNSQIEEPSRFLTEAGLVPDHE